VLAHRRVSLAPLLAAAAPLFAPLPGLVRGRRYTYAWASLFAVPYVAFAVTEFWSIRRRAR